MNSDRNLLFGILALQMDFITRDQLVSAMGAWVLDKSKPLEDILEEQLALSGEARGVLTPLVEMHIKHHGDATQSLAVISSVGSIKHALETIGDDEVEASIGHLPDASVTNVESTAPFEGKSDTLRYQILRPHAKGGLGEVSVALDTELNREVALKEIQDQYADHPQSRSRFVVEAEITGGLEHPGIVPVYGLGHYDDGRPYYAMRFIKGDSLKQAADEYHKNKSGDPSERSLRLRKLLGRFVDVCNAIEYAHSRGVLHRDLKPGNIMLGKYGETLVVDWGLAKPVGRSDKDTYLDEQTLKPSSGSGSAPTQMGKAIGTPAYMSPEQADGRLDELGATSDVYSLGATLYYVLTGKGPIDGTTNVEVLEKVRRGELVPPREVDADIPKPLSAICVRSMAKDQGQRYESPHALADDVERFLADEPVTSFTEPMSVRSRRWMRKHPKTVASMAATLLVGLTSTLIVATVVSGKNLELANKNTELDGKNVQLATANSDLNETNDALVTANNKEKAAKEEAQQQQRIAQAVRDFLQKDLLQQADVTEQADRLLAIGGTQFQTEQNPTIRELLDRAAAELTPEKIEHKFPNQPLVQAEILGTLGKTHIGIGRYEQAVSCWERSRGLYEQALGSDHPDTLASIGNLASAYADSGNLNEALPLFKKNFEKSTVLLGADNPETLIRMNNLAKAYEANGNLNEALPLFKKNFEKNTALLGTDHHNTLTSMNNLAYGYASSGDFERAVTLYEETLERRTALLGADHPGTLTVMSNLASALEKIGELNKALAIFKAVFDKRTALLGEEHPDTLTSMNNLAYAYESAGEFDVALRLSKSCVTRTSALLGPDHPATLSSMHNLASAHDSTGQLDKAISLYESTLERRSAHMGASHPDTLNSMNNLAVAYESAGELEKAIPLYESAFDKRTLRLGASHPDTLNSMNNLATAYTSVGELQKAMQLHKDELGIIRDKHGTHHPDTLNALNDLGKAYFSAEQIDKAVPVFEDALTKRRAILGHDHPDTIYTMNNLAAAYAVEDLRKALPLYEDAVETSRAKLGVGHPVTFRSMNNLAAAYWQMQNLDKSISLFETMQRHASKMSKKDRVILNANLGVNYRDAGMMTKGLPLLEEAHLDSHKYPDLQWVRVQLIVSYIKAGEQRKGVSLVERELVELRARIQPDTAGMARELARIGSYLMQLEAWVPAVRCLRECVDICKVHHAGRWPLADAKSLLGTALTGRAKQKIGDDPAGGREALTEGEPLLLDGYNGMQRDEDGVPEQYHEDRLTAILECLVDLYTTWDKPDEAAKWQAELDKRKAESEKSEAGTHGKTSPPKDEASGESK